MESHTKKKDKRTATKESVNLCNNIFIGIDGSEGAHNAVEIAVKEFYRKGLDRITLVHITNLAKEHEKGIQYHSKTIHTNYSEYLKQHVLENDYEIIFEERKETENVFEQINAIANSKKADLLVLGFRGYKGNKKGPNELSKSVTYLVHKPLIPVLIVKEKTHREYRPELGFKFLFCVESQDSKSFKAFNHILRYIDADSDIIHGITVDTGNGEAKKVETAFKEVTQKNEIKNVQFDVVPAVEGKSIKTAIHDWIQNHIKQESHFIDFVVMGYNPSKYIYDKEGQNTTVEIIKDIDVNVFFDH